jgi:HK97 family phage major capsid protein
MTATDALLARYSGEIEERQNFINGVLESAEKETRDLTSQELELLTKTRDRISDLNKQVDPIREAARIAHDSRERTADIARMFRDARNPEKAQPLEYRSAGEYVLEMWRASLGDNDAGERLELYNRAAAHQTTAGVPGLLPVPVVAPVVNFIDSSRPLVSALGPRQLPAQNWSRPKVTQHTSVASQSAEKAELVSQAMVISKLTGTAYTYGGYVNVSRQAIDFTQPGVMDIVINDLAAQYAIQTEGYAATTFAAAATAGSTLPTGANTADQIAGALWAAASAIYTATKGIGRVFAVIPPGLLAGWGPVFPPYGPMNQQGQGFSAADFSTGLAGMIAGIPIYVSNAIAANTALVMSSAAAEVYEERIGSLQVVEPSVLGIQVAYAGYFSALVIESTGIIKITKTP